MTAYVVCPLLPCEAEQGCGADEKLLDPCDGCTGHSTWVDAYTAVPVVAVERSANAQWWRSEL